MTSPRGGDLPKLVAQHSETLASTAIESLGADGANAVSDAKFFLPKLIHEYVTIAWPVICYNCLAYNMLQLLGL